VSRVRRLLVTDRIFFVTVNLRRKLPTLDNGEFPLILEAIEESRAKLGFRLCGYVLMPDHWHALLGVPHPLTISRAVQDVKWISARSLNRRRHTRGPVWQHQFWDRFVRHQQELSERLAYMHLNPVRRRIVDRPEQWRWSSYNNFSLEKADMEACPIQIDYVRLPDRGRN
jgi:putative transposase